MNNEIGRKLTSLTLMTIMLASAFSAFAPSALPEAAAANANLYVSAENSQFQNYFAGPQVIEVVVIDSDIKDTTDPKGEPDVTINGNKLRMVQASDGNWYGYFADRAQAQKADATAAAVGLSRNATGLDFGTFCTAGTASTVLGPAFTQTVGVAIANFAPGGSQGETTISACTAGISGLSTSDQNNVVRENKTVNRGVTGNIGQIGLTSTAADKGWPFIQLYDFSAGGSVAVQYNKGGGIQKTTLTFDTIPSNMIGMSLDRSNYPQNSQVHATMTDPQLNIDPTDEDSWSFGTLATNNTIYYQLFDENGAKSGDGRVRNTITGNLTGLMFEKNGLVKLNGDAQSSGTNVVLIQDNTDSVIAGSGDLTTASTSTIGNGATDGMQPVTFTEQSPNNGVFGTYDELDVSVLKTTSGALRGTSASLDYNDKSYSIVVANNFGTITFDEGALGGEWNSGEEVAISLVDGDQNLNGRADEDLDVFSANTTIPSIRVGSPLTLASATTPVISVSGADLGGVAITTDAFSDRAKLIVSADRTAAASQFFYVNVTTAYTHDTLSTFVKNASSANGGAGNGVFNYFQYDIRSIGTALGGTGNVTNIAIGNATNSKVFNINGSSSADFTTSDFQDIIDLGKPRGQGLASFTTDSKIGGTGFVTISFKLGRGDGTLEAGTYPITADFLRFGINNDGSAASDRFNDAIYRLELEETGDNTATFIGSVEYIMLNQINVNQTSTYKAISSTDDEVVMVVGEDLTDEDSVRANFNDVGADGPVTQIADQVEAPTHSGVVSFDASNYKLADTVTVTLQDQDLNTDSDLIDIFTAVSAINDVAADTIGKSGYGENSASDPRGRLLDITFDDQRWLNGTKTGDSGGIECSDVATSAMANGLFDSGFTLVETGSATGIFVGNFVLPSVYCARTTTTGSTVTTQGTDIEVNYVDFRDASGEIVEVGDGAGVRANTGSVSLDRTVYPLPWGEVADLAANSAGTKTTGAPSSGGKSIFPIHKTSLVTVTSTGATENVDTVGETLGSGDIILHVQVNDPDFNTSLSGEDKIQTAGDVAAHGPVKVVVSRGSANIILATAGFSTATGNTGRITVGTDTVDNTAEATTAFVTRELGPITETAPDSGIFEFDVIVRYTDGPTSTTCPSTGFFASLQNSTRNAASTFRFDTASTATTGAYCLLQGDIVTVTYRDPADASGQPNTVTDSATFDLRNGAIQSDKSVYIIGGDMILTVIEPDFDRDNDTAETYDLDVIEWDSDAATITMGNLGGSAASFDPEPSDLRETGDSTGIFQSVIEIPASLGASNDKLERGEEIILEYTDWGPSGADFVGQENEDVNLTLFTSNFGATVELDQKVYTWTDKVYITIIAPDHNFDSNLIDTVGDTADDPVKVATRGHKLDEYHLTESGVDTGIFTGEVILTGFGHDADGNTATGTATTGFDAPNFSGTPGGSTTPVLGPTNGFLQADDDDGLTVSFEFSEDETVVGSALIRWNIGEVSWVEASYPATGQGVVRIIDPDMNLHPEAIDNFAADAWSDSDAGGIDLTVTETNEASGIFEGTVFFTTTDESSGHRLRVAEGDTVTAEYQDNTLPSPYTSSDELDITGTAFIGTVVPPLERAPASNARVVDAFGNSLDEVSVDQQVQITADLINGQDREQAFAYLVQIQDENSVTVSLAWITGSLAAGQSFSPALSWIPATSGTYTATVFVWESVDNPTALSPPVSVDITVS